MKRLVGVLVLLGAASSFQFFGCNTVDPVVTEQQFFSDVILGNDAATRDLATSDQEALHDGEMYGITQKALPPSIQAVMDDRIVPQKWGLMIESASRSVTRTSMEGDSVAIVRADVTFSGHYVILGTVNGVLDTIFKPYTESMHRYFRFVRVANTKSARLNWRLDAVSILVGGMTGAQIAIQSVQVTTPTDSVLTVTDPDNYYMEVTHRWMHRLPLWGFNSTVVVQATVHSNDADSDFVTLHYVPKHSGNHRLEMAKISETADPAGGFVRVYSATLTIPGNDKKFSHVVLSATTSGSVFSTDTTNFSSVIWGVPYKTSE